MIHVTKSYLSDIDSNKKYNSDISKLINILIRYNLINIQKCIKY